MGPRGGRRARGHGRRRRNHLWKVAGQRAVVGILELPDAESVDRALAGLPIVKEMGAGVKTEVLPIYDYRTFAEDLKKAVNG
ncbi:MAG TPA: muconolactone Delta-isomerase family protein [Thermoleophilaceae bacterium]|nr:muconolactone Delta-isomerase family protein [Thermoleophilaceae bacterium]